MIGTLRPPTEPGCKQVTVIGAGVSGLLLADTLDRLGYEVTLHEAGTRAGGLIATRRTPLGPAEAAAHSLLATPAVRELCAGLGVELVEVQPGSKARYILRRGKLRRFPLGPLEALRAFFRAYLVPNRAPADPERATMEEWALRHFGRAALQYLFTPFLRGIYAASPAEICVGAAFPSLVVPRGQSFLSALLARKVTRRAHYRRLAPPRSGPGVMMSPRGGMQALTDALEARLRKRLGERFRLGAPVKRLPATGQVALCVPTQAAADLLLTEDAALARALARVAYAPLVSATVFVRKSELEREPAGVGVLFPEAEERPTLGILFNSSAFAGRVRDASQHASLTFMLGGTGARHWPKASDAEIRQAILRELRDLFGLRGEPAAIEIQRWERAIPLYNADLMAAWAAARKGWCGEPGRILFGNHAGQVSLRGMIEACAHLLDRNAGRP